MDKLREAVRDWLDIQPADNQRISIKEPYSFETEVIRNKIWYRGNADEIEQLYKQLDSGYGGTARFWASVPDTEQIRKIHSGLPAMMVDTIAYIVCSDMSDIAFEGESGQDVWKDIKEAIGFDSLISNAITQTLVASDGAFKISIDTDLSSYPLVEFFPAERVSYLTRHGQVYGVDFWTDITDKKGRYRLRERYAMANQECTVTYALFKDGAEIPLDTLKDLSVLKPVRVPGNYLMAVPLKFYDNPRFPGRGKSIFDSKTDVFDAHDEVISQWIDAVRSGRVTKYIPEDMIPRDPRSGALLTTAPVNSFGTTFIKTEALPNETGKQGQIDVIQPEIRYEAYASTYASTLDMCLQGILSPATLGIDLGKMSSADAQREKKDVTGHTRNTITSVLEKVIPRLVSAVLMTYDNMRGLNPSTYTPSVTFGEYGAPDFGTRVETISKAAAAGVMSIESQVDELWGASKDEEWKKAEVANIKRLKGIEEVDEPQPGDELISEVETDDVDGNSGSVPGNGDPPDRIPEAESEKA